MARRLLTGCAVGMVLVAGCSSGTPEASPGSTSTTVSTSDTTVSTSVSTSAETTETQPSGPAACTAADLSVARGKGGVGGGSAYFSLLFTNTGDETCTMTGYPTVSMADRENGVRVGAPAGSCEGTSCRDQGNGLSAEVTLKPGDVAHAEVRQANAGNLDPEACDPQAVEGLQVTPPGDTGSVFVAGESTGCANTEVGLLQVGAVAAGAGEDG